jgi:hypothetical protein
MLEAVRLRLHAFLHKPVTRKADEYVDPMQAVPTALHNQMFAGPVTRLPRVVLADYAKVLAEIQQQFGDEVASAIETAAQKAGVANNQIYLGEVSSTLTPIHVKATPTCARILTSQQSNFVMLDDILTYLKIVDEDRDYKTVLRAEEKAMGIVRDDDEDDEDEEDDDDDCEDEGGVDAETDEEAHVDPKKIFHGLLA